MTLQLLAVGLLAVVLSAAAAFAGAPGVAAARDNLSEGIFGLPHGFSLTFDEYAQATETLIYNAAANDDLGPFVAYLDFAENCKVVLVRPMLRVATNLRARLKALAAAAHRGATRPGERSLAALLPRLEKTHSLLTNLDRIRKDKEFVTLTPEIYMPFGFPRDEGCHHWKLVEWWYQSGHLATAIGNRHFGFEACFFRIAPVLNMAHVSVTDEDGGKFHQNRMFFLPWTVRHSDQKLDLVYDKWSLKTLEPERYKLKFDVDGIDLDLTLTSKKPVVPINGTGIIDMPEGTYSYYYSKTRLDVVGTLTEGGDAQTVAGQAWHDHQWGNFVALKIGWDRFFCQDDQGTDYNIWSFRTKGTNILMQSYVNITDPRGKTESLRNVSMIPITLWTSPNTRIVYPIEWMLKVPEKRLALSIIPTVQNQELPRSGLFDAQSYWMGSSRIEIQAPWGRTTGNGYTELVGYTTDSHPYGGILAPRPTVKPSVSGTKSDRTE